MMLVNEILSVTIGLKHKRIVAITDYMLADRFGRIELMSRHRSHYLWIFNPSYLRKLTEYIKNK